MCLLITYNLFWQNKRHINWSVCQDNPDTCHGGRNSFHMHYLYTPGHQYKKAQVLCIGIQLLTNHCVKGFTRHAFNTLTHWCLRCILLSLEDSWPLRYHVEKPSETIGWYVCRLRWNFFGLNTSREAQKCVKIEVIGIDMGNGLQPVQHQAITWTGNTNGEGPMGGR